LLRTFETGFKCHEREDSEEVSTIPKKLSPFELAGRIGELHKIVNWFGSEMWWRNMMAFCGLHHAMC
jgi:hypothetical protein